MAKSSGGSGRPSSFNSPEKIITGLRSGNDNARVAADAFINQVESGARFAAQTGRLSRSQITRINKILRSGGSASDALQRNLTEDRIGRIQRAQQILSVING